MLMLYACIGLSIGTMGMRGITFLHIGLGVIIVLFFLSYLKYTEWKGKWAAHLMMAYFVIVLGFQVVLPIIQTTDTAKFIASYLGLKTSDMSRQTVKNKIDTKVRYSYVTEDGNCYLTEKRSEAKPGQTIKYRELKRGELVLNRGNENYEFGEPLTEVLISNQYGKNEFIENSPDQKFYFPTRKLGQALTIDKVAKSQVNTAPQITPASYQPASVQSIKTCEGNVCTYQPGKTDKVELATNQIIWLKSTNGMGKFTVYYTGDCVKILPDGSQYQPNEQINTSYDRLGYKALKPSTLFIET
jgi:hypothetical protein